MDPRNAVSRSGKTPTGCRALEIDVTSEPVLGEDLIVINGRRRLWAPAAQAVAGHSLDANLDMSEDRASLDGLSIPQRARR